MERLVSKAEVRQAVRAARHNGQTVALVPTMGALHEGHLTLVQEACKRADYVVASVFVNPMQFGPTEDYGSYPRDIERDLSMLSAEGVDLVFTPTPEGMYAPDASVAVDPGIMGALWEGAIRPIHFRGVCTVVAKLFSIVAPDLAFFGEKDYQQLQIIRRMVRDLDLPVKVQGVPIMRAADGLALSSRNVYLSAEERAAATALYRCLIAAAEGAREGQHDTVALGALMRTIVAAEPLVTIEYAEVVDPDSLVPIETLTASARGIVAARIGTTRLIDNMAVAPR